MRCCICKKEVDEYGNNPYPLCQFNNPNNEKCCDDCNLAFVVPARTTLIKSNGIRKTPKTGDLVIVTWSKNSSLPLETAMNCPSGVISGETIATNPTKTTSIGKWGFILDLAEDQYFVIE